MAPNKELQCEGLMEVSGLDESQAQPLAKEPYKPRIIWGNVFFISLFHLVAVGYIFTVHRLKLPTFFYGIVLGMAAGFGVTAGAHRLWAHRSYKAKWPLRVILLICYSLAGQNTLFDWVRDHRVHHRFSETDADPHNSNRGFFFAHVGWLMQRKHPEVLRKGSQIDMSDILADPLISFHTKYFSIIKLLVCFVLPPLVAINFWGEDPWLAYVGNAFLRYCVGLNCTWLVNSAAHIYGNKPYDKRIRPSENLTVAVMAMGEGWHNYHHVFPWDYKAAELGNYRYNVTTFLIDCFARIGWAYDLKSASPSLVQNAVEQHGDGSYPQHDELCPQPQHDDGHDHAE